MRALRLIGRAVLLRCPRCGKGGLFRTWFSMHDRCSHCFLHFEREEGFHSGGMALNLVVSELLFVALFVGILVVSWPNPPWDFLRWGSIALMILFPLAFYPLSKAIYLALDLAIRPVETWETGESADAPVVSGQRRPGE
jgi:uncharacterized protein (DUF983 family)